MGKDNFKINQDLLIKAQGEFIEFVCDIKENPNTIVSKADEISIKNQIVNYIEHNADDIPLKIREHLLKDGEYVLDTCYQNIDDGFEEIKEEIDSAISDSFAEMIFESCGEKIVVENKSVNKEQKEQSLAEWERILATTRDFHEISKMIGYGFSKNDIKNLAILHSMNNFQNKIEKLLDDCNFHHESSDFHNKRYREYLTDNHELPQIHDFVYDDPDAVNNSSKQIGRGK